MQESGLKLIKLCGFFGIIFPLGLSSLDSARENEIRLQLFQSYKQRAESTVVGSLIMSTCFNHAFLVTCTEFH